METQYVIEKFTRCPQCRSFSLRGLKPDEAGGKTGILSGSPFVCSNCGTQFTLKGDTLKEISGLSHQNQEEKLQEQEESREPEEEIKVNEPVTMESHQTFKKTAMFLIFFICLIIGGIILLLHSWHQEEGQIEALEFNSNEIKTSVNAKKEVIHKEKEEKKPNLVKATIPEVGDENEPVLESKTAQVTQIPNELENPGVKTEQIPQNEPIFYKIFDVSRMKVRSSSPNRSDRSLRWFFKQKTITVKRSETQRVYIAGDASGKAGWAVDDEIIVNGEKIKGISTEITQPGNIPQSRRLPPCDITHLVSADRKTVLNIKLADYGIFWGNTSLYLVIM